MKRKIFLRCIIGIFLFVVLSIGVVEQLQGNIADGIVRLHIVANSDSARDQEVKLAVRDAVIEASKKIFPDGIKKDIKNKDKEALLYVAKDTLAKNGAHYDVAIITDNFYFPTKEYENITLPSGNYDAVKIVLGEGMGQNWWCVMYPPLCFSESSIGVADDESQHILKESMGDFSYEIISSENIKTVPAFKAVEMWQNLKEKIRKSL